MIICIDKR